MIGKSHHLQKMKVFKFLTRTITTILFVLVIALFIGAGACYFLKLEPRVVMSGSMEPEIQTGSMCFIDKKVAYDEIQVGDIIAFKPNESTLVTHRVIAITDEGIETKGDNNQYSDGISTTADNFYGETVYWLPQVGYLYANFKTTKGVIIWVTVVATLFLANAICNREDEEEKKEDDGDGSDITDLD